jgi:hypothetical protein
VRSLVGYIEELADVPEGQAIVMHATCGAAGQRGSLTLAACGLLAQRRRAV